MVDHFTTADGLRLAYDDRGAGVPLLCLAGLTRNMDDFEPVAEAFADRARILRLDSRGRGASDRDPDFHNYTVAHEAADAIALLDHLGIDRAAILGTSRGGLIAMVLAATARDRLRGVMLNDIGPVIDPRGLDRIMDYLGRPPAFASIEAAVAGLPRAMAPDFANVTEAQWRAYARRSWRETPDGLALRYDPRLRDALEAQGATQLPELWPLFEALGDLPVALLRGANSAILTRTTFDAMKARLPALDATEVADRGHVPFLDEPESRAAIARFLAALDPERTPPVSAR